MAAHLGDSLIPMSDLKEQVLSLPTTEKREILEALQRDMENEPIPGPIAHILEERRREYHAGETKASPADEVFDRLLKKHPGETDPR